MNKLACFLLSLFAGLNSHIVHGAEDAFTLPASAKILDPNLIMHSWPYPVISPDGEWVAYISRGFVCVCSLEDGQPRRLHEVPRSWTHFLALPENEFVGGQFSALASSLDHEEYREMTKKIDHKIFGLRWTPESDGVVFGVQSYDEQKELLFADVFYAPLEGDVARLAQAEWPFSGRGISGDFRVTRDRRFIVSGSEWGRSLIWGVERNRPRGSVLMNLTPSPTSDRWIAVEKDTRELVIVDQDFSVIKRFEEVVAPNENGYKLHWSPDERFVICQNPIGMDHYSNWDGFRLNLETNERREFSGDYWNEIIAFTGSEGEFIRIGLDGESALISGLNEVGAYVQIVPTNDDPSEYVWRLPADSKRAEEYVALGLEPQVTHTPDFSLFTIGLPRAKSGRPGVVYHLLSRKHQLWRMSSHDAGEYQSPYQVIGFAKQGEMILGHDKHRMFAIPVAEIRTDENKVMPAGD
ncbi:hypothetical protein [Lacipirellula sp.]|uniref:hypothetical protein n=1 Tax=Lacipirellula sp. TaxID=2691419 RepID=UPI003D10BF09